MKIDPTTHPISWFKDTNIDRSLILKPPYQRKPVWTRKQQAYLIDTILKKYHMPEIYVHRVTNSEGRSVYNIVDGQQRIKSILDFVNGDLALDQEYTPEYPDYNFDDLPEKVKEDFWGYTLYCREITSAEEEDVRNMFKRMNRNVVPLNPQELRHATYQGEFIRLMEEIADDDYWAENKIVTANEIRRMNDVQYVSDLFLSIMLGIQDKTKDMDKHYETLEENFTEKTKWKNLFANTRNIVDEILPELRQTRWHTKTDFYTLFVAVSDSLNKGYVFASNKQTSAHKALIEFSSVVTEAAANMKHLSKYPKTIREYVQAGTKSTTDRARRLTRHNIVKSLISPFMIVVKKD